MDMCLGRAHTVGEGAQYIPQLHVTEDDIGTYIHRRYIPRFLCWLKKEYNVYSSVNIHVFPVVFSIRPYSLMSLFFFGFLPCSM
jgi:hypothetical protein